MSFRKEPPSTPGDDWENSLFIHAKRFPVKKALKLAQSLDFGQLAPAPPEWVSSASEPERALETRESFLELPPAPEVPLYEPPEEPSFEEELVQSSLEDDEAVAEPLIPPFVMPPHLTQESSAKTENRPTASPLPPMGGCFEDQEVPEERPVSPSALTPQDNDAAFDVFLRTLLDSAKASVPPEPLPQPSGVQAPFYGLPMMVAGSMPDFSHPTPVVLYPVAQGAAAVPFAFATTQTPGEGPVPVSEPEPEQKPAVSEAVSTSLPPVVVPLGQWSGVEDPVFRTQTLDAHPVAHAEVVIPLLDCFTPLPTSIPSAGPDLSETSGPTLSLVPASGDSVLAENDMGTVIPFRRESTEDLSTEPVVGESIDDTVVPFPIKPPMDLVEDNPPLPAALEGFSLDFPDFSREDEPEDVREPVEEAFVSPAMVPDFSLDVDDASEAEEDLFGFDAPWPEPVEDDALSFDAPSPFAEDVADEVEELAPVDILEESVVPEEGDLEPVLSEAWEHWESDLGLDVSEDELEPGDAPEEALDILASAHLGEEFQMLLVHLDGLYALMVDNGENAVLLKTFDTNPLADESAVFMVSEEALLETGKAMYLAHVGTWQGIISLEGDDASVQAEMPWSDS